MPLTVALQFCNVTLCCWARSRWHCNGSLSVHHLGQAAFFNYLSIQMMAQSSSKLSVMCHPTTQHHIPKCLNLHGQNCWW